MPTSTGTSCITAATRFRRYPPTGGTSRSSSIPTRTPRARWSPGAPGSSMTSPASTHRSSGVSAREANLMDPQHRLLLETAWQAVEHSGTAPPTTLANTRTGVFVGLATHDFLGMASDALTYPPEIEAYLAVGTSSAAAAGRISYRLGGLQGPRSPSTRHAARRWWPFTRPARRYSSTNAIWP